MNWNNSGFAENGKSPFATVIPAKGLSINKIKPFLEYS